MRTRKNEKSGTANASDNTGKKRAKTEGGLTQSERFIAKARELGLDEREETFDAALTKVARHKSVEAPKARERG